MYTKIETFLSPGAFAGQYKGKTGKPVRREYIHKLINKEASNPGSTGLDVIEIGGSYYVRYSEAINPVAQDIGENENVGQRLDEMSENSVMDALHRLQGK